MVARPAVILISAIMSLCGAVAAVAQLSDTFTNWLDHPAIAYSTHPTTDPVSGLIQQMGSGAVRLTSDRQSGYLRSVLEALGVPIQSQVVVFANDSVQRMRISRENPRAIYFNDSVAVGWVRGGFIELAAQDPRQGVIFYVLDSTPDGAPSIRRRTDCLTCHYSYSTVGVPGMLARSTGQSAVDHRLPLEQRWGGWYVTLSRGSFRHLGNLDPKNLSNPSNLSNLFDTSGYLSPHSDIVALLVFEHQMHMMNLLTRIGWEARVAEYERSGARAIVPPWRQPGRDDPISLREAAVEVVDYLLFVDEAPLPDGIRGSTDFAERFASEGPRDHSGRSLRQLDLARRLMRYPCSYLIYSRLFEALPSSAKDAIYLRLWQVLSGQEQAAKYARLSVADRTAIIEILHDTKPELPAYFRPSP